MTNDVLLQTMTPTNDRPVLSSERSTPHRNMTAPVNSNKNLVMSPRWGSTPRLTDWTVSRNVTMTRADFILLPLAGADQLAMELQSAAVMSANWVAILWMSREPSCKA
jgi:hypothetical protein